MSHAMCSFNGGTVAAFCEDGCCGSSCCSTSAAEGESVVYALIGTISALIFIFIVVVLLYFFLRRKGYCLSRADPEKGKPWKPKPRNPDKNSKKNPNAKKGTKKPTKGQILALNAFDWHGKKKNVHLDSKDTQTENYKCLPGDFIKWTQGFWLPVKRDKNAPKIDRTHFKDAGVNTDAVKNNANNTRTINIEPKMNNTDIVAKVNTSTKARPLPPPKVVKPVQFRAAPISNYQQPPNADYSDVKLPYDVTPKNQPSGGRETQHPVDVRPILQSGGEGRDSSAKSVSFGPSPQPTVSTPRNPERQDTIELLNDFTRQMMNTK